VGVLDQRNEEITHLTHDLDNARPTVLFLVEPMKAKP
jgi:hypothetical protein